jgi:hypothetical protein
VQIEAFFIAIVQNLKRLLFPLYRGLIAIFLRRKQSISRLVVLHIFLNGSRASGPGM